MTTSPTNHVDMCAAPIGTSRATLILALAVCASVVFAQPTQAQVNITTSANIYGAGHLAAPGPGGHGGGVLPVEVTIPPGAGRTVQFSLSGTADYGPCCPATGPDGGAATGIPIEPQYGGLAGCEFALRARYLAGVFLDDTEPVDPPPPHLVFADAGFAQISPDLRQIFFVGDGLTGEGTGASQVFHIPDTATRLFLGYSDRCGVSPNVPGWYEDNSGTVSGTVTFTGVTAADDPVLARQPLRSYPNPFRLSTTVAFSTEISGAHRLSIHDVRGRLVRTLVDEFVEPGEHQARWDGRDQYGDTVESGLYYSRLSGPTSTTTGKLLILDP